MRSSVRYCETVVGTAITEMFQKQRETAHMITSSCYLQLCNNNNPKCILLDVEMRGYVTSEV